MKFLIMLLATVVLVSCAHTTPGPTFVGFKYTEKVGQEKGRKIASLVDTNEVALAQGFSSRSRQDAQDQATNTCVSNGGRTLKVSIWEPGETVGNYWQAVVICHLGRQINQGGGSRGGRNEDPNARFCYLRSTPQKCGEIGVCEWIPPKTSHCQARSGYENDPNGRFCYLRSTPQKCTEIGVCEFVAAEVNGHCQAR